MATESFVLKVLEVIEETSDAHSIVFEVPEELAEQFTYTPGQFLTLAVPSDQTGLAARCYSLSSAPHSGRHQITVKRTVDGYASNWINDNLREGDTMRVLPPSGIFTPNDLDADLLLFAGAPASRRSCRSPARPSRRARGRSCSSTRTATSSP